MSAVRSSLILTAALAAMFTFVCADVAAQSSGAQPLFSDDSVLNVRIEAPIDTLMRDRPDEEYLDGKFSYTAADGAEHTFDLKLRTRGKFRRQKSTCEFAPIRLNFRKKQVEGTAFDGQDKLKLVTHCETRRDRYEQMVLREYLAYRILQTLTDKHFGARLMKITYVDTENMDDDPITRYGFVIEDEDDIGARLGLEKIDVTALRYSDLDRNHTMLITLYEYLIGNTDYSLVRGPNENDCCHNAIPFSDGTISYSIPYDFDHAGIVDAPYAKPNPQFNTRNVRTRVYRGLCAHNDILPDTIDHIVEKRDEIFGLVDGLEDLSDKDRDKVTKYLEQFFDDITDPKQVDRKLVRKCS